MTEKLISFAKVLRKQSTDTETKLWYHLRSKKFESIKFRRQAVIGNYIVDFVSHEKRLVIECDGGQHLMQEKRDQERDRWLQNQGYKVLRFWDDEILQKTSEVLEQIYRVCHGTDSP